jgi:hypothetical protein
MSRRKKKTAETLRSHLILLASVSTLTFLVVLLGRSSAGRRPTLLPPAHSHLELRRGLSLSIGEGTPRLANPVTMTPIPLPEGEDALSAGSGFVPLAPPTMGDTDRPSASFPLQPVADSTLNAAYPMDAPPAELRWHRVVEGETLENIAHRYFGNEKLAAEIFALNRDALSRPDLLPLGAYLRLPPAPPAATATGSPSQPQNDR